jgi:hypothetical protein
MRKNSITVKISNAHRTRYLKKKKPIGDSFINLDRLFDENSKINEKYKSNSILI